MGTNVQTWTPTQKRYTPLPSRYVGRQVELVPQRLLAQLVGVAGTVSGG